MDTSNLTVLIANQPGRWLTLPYQEKEPILHILDHISRLLSKDKSKDESKDSKSNYSCRENKLYINGIPLENTLKPISHFRIFGSVLVYYSRPLPRLASSKTEAAPPGIIALTLTGKKIHLPYDPQFTVQEIKEMLEASEGIPAVRLRICIPRLKVLDDTLTMASCGLGIGDKIFIVYRRSGQVVPGGGVAAFDMDHCAEPASAHTPRLLRLEFIESSSPGRNAEGGTNIECYCQCQPTSRVICPQGHGFTDLLLPPPTRCPCCYQPNRMTRPRLVGFVECKFRFHGIRVNSGEQFSSNWTVANQEDGYQYFDPSHYCQGFDWLVVESTHIDRYESCLVCLNTVTAQDNYSNECGHWIHDQCYQKLDKVCPGCHLNQCLKFESQTVSPFSGTM